MRLADGSILSIHVAFAAYAFATMAAERAFCFASVLPIPGSCVTMLYNACNSYGDFHTVDLLAARR